MYIYAPLQICGHLTNRMCSNNCLVRLAVCYACLLAWFHTVGFTFPYIPPVRIEFSISWTAPCTVLGCLLTVYPGCFPVCNYCLCSRLVNFLGQYCKGQVSKSFITVSTFLKFQVQVKMTKKVTTSGISH